MALVKKSNLVNGRQEPEKYSNDLDSDVVGIFLAFRTLLEVQKLKVNSVSDYANNATAIAAGLTVGNVYRNGDSLNIVH